MSTRRRASRKAYARAIIAIVLFVTWGLSAFTGFLLWLAPHGQQSGRVVLLGLTKGEWGDIHFWFAVATFVVTVTHIIIDWKALRGCVRYLATTHRGLQVGS